MFPSAYVVTNHLGGAESRQNEGNPALGSGLPAARLPFGPGVAWLVGPGSGTWVSSDAEICDPFGLSLGPKEEISRSEGSNLDRTAALRVQRRLKSKKF